MERSLYRCLWLIAGALAWATWAPEGALSGLLEYFDAQVAQAQAPAVQPPAEQSPLPNPYIPSYQPNSPYAPTPGPVAGPVLHQQNPASFSRPLDQPQAPPAGNLTGPLPGAAVNSNIQALDFEPAQILASVGSEVILAGDVEAIIRDTIATKGAQIPPEQMDQVRAMLTKQVLNQMVETKLVYMDAKNTIPEANLPKIEGDLSKEFEKSQLPKLYKMAKVETRQELENYLRKQGTSLDAQKKGFFEKTIATQWFQSKIKLNEDYTPEEMLEYYHTHITDFDITAQAKWEELMVRFDKFPTKQAAWAEMASMGDQVLRGTPFTEVAKTRSQGPTASDGGAYETTTKGGLACAEMDSALFGLPIGRMSQIIESDRGFHIVRVTERIDAGRTSFPEAQSEIRKKLKNERFKKQMQEYLAKLKGQIPVHTIFDGTADNSQQVGTRPTDTVPR